jgi:hypothetical protein
MLSRRSLPDSPPPWDSTRSRCQWFCFLVDGDCLAVGVVEVRGPANAEGVSRLLRTSRSSERDARRSALSLQRLPAVAIPMTNYRFRCPVHIFFGGAPYTPTTPSTASPLAMSTALFTPITVGEVKLAHRVAMAPLTRFR